MAAVGGGGGRRLFLISLVLLACSAVQHGSQYADDEAKKRRNILMTEVNPMDAAAAADGAQLPTMKISHPGGIEGALHLVQIVPLGTLPESAHEEHALRAVWVEEHLGHVLFLQEYADGEKPVKTGFALPSHLTDMTLKPFALCKKKGLFAGATKRAMDVTPPKEEL